MAELSITAANVHIYGTGTTLRVVTAASGVTPTAGQSVYLTSNNDWDLADADDTAVTAGSGDLSIVVVGAGEAGGQMVIATAGEIDLGATLVEGTAYAVGETPGSIAPATDYSGWASPTRLSLLGTAVSSSKLLIGYNANAATK